MPNLTKQLQKTERKWKKTAEVCVKITRGQYIICCKEDTNPNILSESLVQEPALPKWPALGSFFRCCFISLIGAGININYNVPETTPT